MSIIPRLPTSAKIATILRQTAATSSGSQRLRLEELADEVDRCGQFDTRTGRRHDCHSAFCPGCAHRYSSLPGIALFRPSLRRISRDLLFHIELSKEPLPVPGTKLVESYDVLRDAVWTFFEEAVDQSVGTTAGSGRIDWQPPEAEHGSGFHVCFDVLGEIRPGADLRAMATAWTEFLGQPGDLARSLFRYRRIRDLETSIRVIHAVEALVPGGGRDPWRAGHILLERMPAEDVIARLDQIQIQKRRSAEEATLARETQPNLN